jgi:hypothetical protein
VAAEDNVSVTLQLRASPASTPAVSMGALSTAGATAQEQRSWPLRTVGFVVAGALAAGAVTFGVLAIEESTALKNARSAFPANAGAISHDANLTTTYSALADSLGVAAIAVGGIALYAALSSSVDRAGGRATEVPSPTTERSKRASVPATRVTVGPASARFEMTF